MLGIKSIESRRSRVVGFDGLHRVGKGTQASKLLEYVENKGGTGVIVRGDGTREGLGLVEGDPHSPEWQERSARLKSFDRTVASWNLASYVLAKELYSIVSIAEAPDVVIVDRSVLSRATFLVHRGVVEVNSELTLEDLYPDSMNGEFPIEMVVPDVIFDMQVRSPDVLLGRLDKDDPKYDFRAENIRGGFMAARGAAEYLPESIRKKVEFIDAGHDPEAIHNYIISLLGHKGLLAWGRNQ